MRLELKGGKIEFSSHPWLPKPVGNIADILNDRLFNNAYFIEIGANDGVQNDLMYSSISRFNLKGAVLEPVSYLFEILKDNYQGFSDIRILNYALGQANESRLLYRLKKTNDPLPPFYEQLASFDLETILTHKKYITDIEKYIITEKVKVITFSELMQKLSITKLDFLIIDTEGYDLEILKTIDLEKYLISTIVFEHKHLSLEDFSAAVDLFNANGYSLNSDRTDTIALL